MGVIRAICIGLGAAVFITLVGMTFLYLTVLVVSNIKKRKEPDDISRISNVVCYCKDCKYYDAEHKWCPRLKRGVKDDYYCYLSKRKEKNNGT